MQSSLFDSESFFSYPSSPIPESSSTLIRLANIDDVNQIGDILTLSFNQFNDLTFWIYPFLKLGICDDLRSRLKNCNSNHFCLVAIKTIKSETEIINKIIGTVELSFRKKYHWEGVKKYAYISNLAVRENYRRQGIATQLLCNCTKIAKNNGLKELYLHVLGSNENAKRLYLQNGYTIYQVETDLYSLFVPSKRRLFLSKSI